MVTLADVARAAGVSASTLSYVLSGKRPISRITRERVQGAITELGYHPRAGARALASNRSNVLALMVPLRSDMYVPVIMEIVTAVVSAAREYDYDVLLLVGHEGDDGLRRVVNTGRADALTRIIGERPSTTGFVVQNEAAIPPLMSLLRQLGRLVPEENSVLAICPDQVALQTSPQLTSVSIPAEEMGQGAVRLIMAQLAGESTVGSTLLPPRLTIRESTAAR
jgi:DNA-binding LacI/PurR family transcriptional regulator